MRRTECEALVLALEQIAEHDFRRGHLAHTGDTARQAGKLLRALTLNVDSVRSMLDHVVLIAKVAGVKKEEVDMVVKEVYDND